MNRSKTYSINFKGGIVSPGYLKEILSAAAQARVDQVRFGLRQNMFIEVQGKYIAAFEDACKSNGIEAFEKSAALPNIVSAYPATHLYAGDSWLREGVYKDIFDLLDYAPRLKINICEQQQSFVPLYTGHLNWITSASPHYWHLCIRLPKTDTIIHWHELIYTNNIASVSKTVEDFILKLHKTDEYMQSLQAALYDALKKTNYICKIMEQPVVPPRFSLPYYEGFNRSGNAYWLGIYSRDELFGIAFLKDICDVCRETKIAQLYTTPWKSIIVKDIDMEQRRLWDYVLGKYRINVRHAANELNWQVEDGTDEGLALKRTAIRHFDKEDVRTYGLCFAVQTKPYAHLYASVLIKKKTIKNPHRLKSLERFDILHTKDFNPNTDEWITYREDVKKEYIGTYLVSLCKLFYSRESEQDLLSKEQESKIKSAPEAMIKKVYQCPQCFSVYDEAVGDEQAGISAGTAFEELPDTYCCPLCETGKAAFTETAADTLYFT